MPTDHSGNAAHIVVVGASNIDLICKISNTYLPRTSNQGTMIYRAGGVARNVAHTLAVLGVPVLLVSAVGADNAAETLINITARAGVDLSHLVRTQLPTGQYIAILSREGDLILGLSSMDCLREITPENLSRVWTTISDSAFLVMDCNLSDHSFTWLAQKASLNGTRLVVECVSVEKCRKVNLLLSTKVPIFLLSANLDEIGALTETAKPRNNSEWIKSAANRLHEQGVKNLMIGLGQHGCFVSDGQQSRIVAPFTKTVLNVNGAGDSALAATLWALSEDHDLFAAARVGQRPLRSPCPQTKAPSPNLALQI
ncbi:carbohydrate kinase family protein [Bradyrhizobium oligotrophicum S58]